MEDLTAPLWDELAHKLVESCGRGVGVVAAPAINSASVARRTSRCPNQPFFRILPEQRDPLVCEFCDYTRKFNGRPNRHKPLSEFESKLNVSLCHFQQFCLISGHVRRG